MRTPLPPAASQLGHDRRFFVLGSVLGLIGVLAGAFGAHALEGRIPSHRVDSFDTAARYHLVHALALLAVAWAEARWPGRWVRRAGWLFVAGVVVFSGSLYVLALTGAGWLGAVTPIGGAAFLAGWAALALGAGWRRARS